VAHKQLCSELFLLLHQFILKIHQQVDTIPSMNYYLLCLACSVFDPAQLVGATSRPGMAQHDFFGMS